MSSGFITERELAEAREKRQEEWEKVRTPDQPLERPEEPYDGRTLYDRLKEQKLKKEMQKEEMCKLKNLVRGLDDDEVEFLDLVDHAKLKAEKQKKLEEEKELQDFREKLAIQRERDSKIRSEVTATKSKASTAATTVATTTRTSQRSLLGSVLKKRKNGDMENNSTSNKILKSVIQPSSTSPSCMENTAENMISDTSLDKGALKCIGILPGIGRYKESSDSEMSSDSDEEIMNGAKLYLFDTSYQKNKKNCEESD